MPQEVQCPAALEEALRRQLVRRLAPVPPFGRGQVNRDDAVASAAFQGSVALAMVRQEVGTGSPQKGSEAAPLSVRAGQVAPLEQISPYAIRT